jgi:hypothetical protein
MSFPCFVPARLAVYRSCLINQLGDRFWSGQERMTLVMLIDLLRVFRKRNLYAASSFGGGLMHYVVSYSSQLTIG